jgi:hypothetical protein
MSATPTGRAAGNCRFCHCLASAAEARRNPAAGRTIGRARGQLAPDSCLSGELRLSWQLTHLPVPSCPGPALAAAVEDKSGAALVWDLLPRDHSTVVGRRDEATGSRKRWRTTRSRRLPVSAWRRRASPTLPPGARSSGSSGQLGATIRPGNRRARSSRGYAANRAAGRAVAGPWDRDPGQAGCGSG